MADRDEATRPEFLLPDYRYVLLVPVPYQIGEEHHQLTELQLRRLTAADMVEVEKPFGGTQKIITAIERMTGIMRVVLMKLDALDIDRIDTCIDYFRQPGSVTGAIS